MDIRTKQEMWEDECRSGCFIQVICPQCGGSSAATCQCARQRFMNNTTDKKVQEFISCKKETQKSRLQQENARLQQQIERNNRLMNDL